MTASEDMPLVVIATDSNIPSGVGSHMLTLARTVGPRYRFVVAFPASQGGALFLKRGQSEGLRVKQIASVESFESWLKEVSAVLLHVHAGIGWEGHGLANAGQMAGIPVVRTEHLPYLLTDEVQKVEHRLGIGMVDRIIFVSQAAADTHQQAGIVSDRAATILNGIDKPQPLTSREKSRRQLALPESAPVAITVARFTAQKNYSLLVAAAKRVVGRVPEVRFLLVGDGPERTAMEGLAVANGLGEVVTFLGERDDVPDLLAAADLFVLPSRFEGLPLVILEAMALGLPIVATHIGGTCEAVGAHYPWLVESGDIDGLAAAILEALTNEEKRRLIGTSNRNRFEQFFGAERMGRETAELYQSVISEKAFVT
jgi:glycosyltransferase involved in cell wall biosynthesis